MSHKHIIQTKIKNVYISHIKTSCITDNPKTPVYITFLHHLMSRLLYRRILHPRGKSHIG
jgi:hypothetical protein